MERDSSVWLGTIKCWSRFVIGELSNVGSLVEKGFLKEMAPAIECELRDLATSYMTVLAHKRSKACALNNGDPFVDNRWRVELEGCLERWSVVGSNAISHARAIGLLDYIVAEEQRRLAELPAAMPATSRFDTSWAI